MELKNVTIKDGAITITKEALDAELDAIITALGVFMRENDFERYCFYAGQAKAIKELLEHFNE